MPLTLVLGPANSAKAGEVLGAYAEAAPRGALLVVPNAADAEHYSRELAEQGCVLRSVLTFTGLAERIAWAAGYTAPRLTGLQRERLIQRAVRGCKLEALGPAAQTPGFTAAAGQLLSELQRSLITPQRFASALRTWAQDDASRQRYGAEVAAICLAYSRELERLRRVDGELFAWRALDALREAPGTWGATPVFFYGFDDLTPLERDAVETLARVVQTEVMVSLTFEAGKTATAARAELVAELTPLAQTVTVLPAREDFYEPGARRALHDLERGLFEGGGDRIDPGGSVRLLESAGELAEAELVSSEVLSLLERGVPADQIAIVVRTLDGSEQAIQRTLRRYGVAVSSDTRMRFGHTALGRSLLGLARCGLLGDRARVADLLDYLRAPGLLAPEVADGLEQRTRCQGVSGVAAARQLLGFEVDEIEALDAAEDPLGELVRHGRRLLAAPHRGQATVLAADEALDALALAALTALPAELQEVGEKPRSEELLELLEKLELGRPGIAGAGAVLLSDSLAIRARRFHAVLVCGLEEGVFPRVPAPEPFLPDELRRELAAATGLRLRPVEDALDRERYLFYAVLSRATEEVVLSYRSSDEDGNLRLPSPFLADVEAVFDDEWPARRRRRSLADVVWDLQDAPTPRERARAQAAATAPAAGEPPAPERRLHAAALAAARHSQVVSAGALECYARCPVMWLVERELSPRPLEPEPEPLARGSYAHDLLEQILSRLGRAVTPESLPEALALLEEGLAELSPQLAPGRAPALRRAVGEAIAGDLRRFLEYEARHGSWWEPRGLELGFGFDPAEGETESLPPLLIEHEGEQVTVRGMIDRVDVEPGGRRAVVRDYKSGAAKSEHRGANWREEQQLQVALYMVAVRELLGLEPVAGLYQPLGGRDMRARGLYTEGAPTGAALVDRDARDPQELQEELQDAQARAVALAVRLRQGELQPTPTTCSRDGCRYPGICRST